VFRAWGRSTYAPLHRNGWRDLRFGCHPRPVFGLEAECRTHCEGTGFFIQRCSVAPFDLELVQLGYQGQVLDENKVSS